MRIKPNQGFSVLETLITCAIVFIVSAAVFQLLISGQFFYDISETKVYAQERVRLVLDRMAQELREGGNAYIRNFPAVDGSFKITPVTDIYTGTSILFQRPSRHSPSNALRLYENDATHANGKIIYGAQDASGAWQENLYLEYCLMEIEGGRRQLMRRVWDTANINFATLATSGTYLSQTVLATDIGQLSIQTTSEAFFKRAVFTVVGRGRDPRRGEMTSRASSEMSFRNK